jgi:hypothetical protein
MLVLTSDAPLETGLDQLVTIVLVGLGDALYVL